MKRSVALCEADGVKARLVALLHGRVRGRSMAALKQAEEHFSARREGVLILQMTGGLLDITFLPEALAGTWELVLHPETEMS